MVGNDVSITISMMSLINYVNMQNNGDISMTSLESQVMQLLDLLFFYDSHLQENDELNDINVYSSLLIITMNVH